MPAAPQPPSGGISHPLRNLADDGAGTLHLAGCRTRYGATHKKYSELRHLTSVALKYFLHPKV